MWDDTSVTLLVSIIVINLLIRSVYEEFLMFPKCFLNLGNYKEIISIGVFAER